MKKITLGLLSLFAFVNQAKAQSVVVVENITNNPRYEKPMTVSLHAEGINLIKQGVKVEYKGWGLGVYVAQESPNFEKNYKGEGYVVEIGGRNFFYKNAYYSNPLMFGEIKFNEKNYDGKYRFWTLINPSVGYQFDVLNGFKIDPSIGFTWRWEPRARGTVDAKDFDNLILKLGIKASYSF